MSRDEAARRVMRIFGLRDDPVQLGTVRRAIDVRMEALGHTDALAYVAHALSTVQEKGVLIDEAIVPETWFFRDGAPFEAVAMLAGSRVGAAPLKVLSAPCSTGEEPYSVAITLLGVGMSSSSFSIDAVDVSARSLEAARRGRYRPNSFRGAGAKDARAHFEVAGDGLEIGPTLREVVRFHHLDLLQDELVGLRPSYDLILCRNLLIYLTPEVQTRLIARLRRMLAPGGMLVFGHAEGSLALQAGLMPVGPPGGFAFAVPSTPPPGPATAPSIALTERSRSPAKLKPPARPPVPARSPAPAKSPPPPAVASSHLASSPVASSALERARSLANDGKLGEAERAAREAVASTPTSADAHALLGVVLSARDASAEARQCLERALYLAPAHVEALVQLAALEEARGDRDKALRLRERARRAAEQGRA